MSMLSVVTIPIMLSVVMLSDIRLNVGMLSIVVPFGVTARNISNLPPSPLPEPLGLKDQDSSLDSIKFKYFRRQLLS
jgi:hypothetical protein